MRGKSMMVVSAFLSVPAMATDCRGVANQSEVVERFAPLLLHPRDEPNLPANVEWFLPRTTLSFYNADCSTDNKNFGEASFDLLERATVTSACNGHLYAASGTRSASRAKTFVLSDVGDAEKRGLADPSQWITYFHAYRNSLGGTTVQYWSFYSFNTGTKVGPIEIGFHGGDWEMVAAVLGPDCEPLSIHVTGHTSIESIGWEKVEKDTSHPILYTEKGGHEAHFAPQELPPYIRHPTWSVGLATFPNQSSSPVGRLVELGSKLNPKVRFLTYSGLWGSRGLTPFSSGYWGPAFNETEMTRNGYLAAWCDGIDNPDQEQSGIKECYPADPQ